MATGLTMERRVKGQGCQQLQGGVTTRAKDAVFSTMRAGQRPGHSPRLPFFIRGSLVYAVADGLFDDDNPTEQAAPAVDVE